MQRRRVVLSSRTEMFVRRRERLIGRTSNRKMRLSRRWTEISPSFAEVKTSSLEHRVMPTYSYPAVRVRQTASSNWLVLFGAPAVEIDTWAGAPQKKELGGDETTGFQRDINEGRVENLKEFYRNDRNIIQNPLLCATRESATTAVTFVADAGATAADGVLTTGVVQVRAESYDALTLLQLLRRVKTDLERRVPSLKQQKVSPQRVAELKQKAQITPDTAAAGSDDELEGSDAAAEGGESDSDATAVVFSDESHILDFWEDISARIVVLEEAGAVLADADEFLGYSRDAMISFLQPVVIVDGQHRLRGAVETAHDLTTKPPFSTEIERAVTAGDDPATVQRQAEVRASRTLPVSLLLTDDPAEHVFQFVVVNQKAMPIDRALLGTIVSTSLSNDELSRVSDRLERAGIRLEQSRTIAYLTRNPESPFYQLVERGLSSDNAGLMPWSVLGSIIRIFQELKGGKLYHQKNDYSDLWRRRYLKDSAIVADWSERGFKNPYDYWKSPEGPWRPVFVRFWRCIRDRLATTKDEEAFNYWGSGRKSYIFNKISLTILAADFFQYLCDRGLPIESDSQIDTLVADWLAEVDPSYFARDWNVASVKKDSTGTRNRWAKLWSEYRKDPQRLPALKMFRTPLTSD